MYANSDLVQEILSDEIELPLDGEKEQTVSENDDSGLVFLPDSKVPPSFIEEEANEKSIAHVSQMASSIVLSCE